MTADFGVFIVTLVCYVALSYRLSYNFNFYYSAV